MKPIRVAVVGCGYWGPNLVRNFSGTVGVDVAYACDVDERRLADIARRFRVERVTREFTEILDDPTVDAVALATPAATHCDLGEAVLRAGKHLWVEKPLARSVEEAERLVQLAQDQRLQLLVDHTFVYTPAVQKIRELIESGALGEVLYFDSVRVNLGLFQSDSNVLWDLGPHDFSIAKFVLGREPREVSAVGISHVPGAFENMAYVTFRYDEPFLGHFHFNWLAPVKVRLTMIGGSRQMIVYDDVELVEKVKVYDKGIEVASAQDVEARRLALISYRSGDMWSPRLEGTEALALATLDFVSAIREGRPPIADGEAGLGVVRCLAAAQRSLEIGGAFVKV